MKYKTVTFSGPSAVGKTYTADVLMKKYPDVFEQAKLYTTRKPRSGDTATDRIFITPDEFQFMIDNNRFIIAEEFGGKMYGFTEEAITPTDRHLLVNIWPWLTRDFSEIEQTRIVGMMPPENWENLLVARMRERGDSGETINKRIRLIQKDISDLQEQSEFVDNSGKMFVIDNDEVVRDQIIPWIEKELDL